MKFCAGFAQTLTKTIGTSLARQKISSHRSSRFHASSFPSPVPETLSLQLLHASKTGVRHGLRFYFVGFYHVEESQLPAHLSFEKRFLARPKDLFCWFFTFLSFGNLDSSRRRAFIQTNRDFASVRMDCWNDRHHGIKGCSCNPGCSEFKMFVQEGAVSVDSMQGNESPRLLVRSASGRPL